MNFSITILVLFLINLPFFLTSHYGTCVLLAAAELLLFMYKYVRSLKVFPSCKGRGVLITGCDSGFGYQLAKRFYLKGFTVFACCLNDQSTGALSLKEISGSETGHLHVLKMDVTSQEEVDSAYKFVLNNLPPLGLWGLVNNAGIAFIGYAEWLPMHNFEKLISVNMTGMVRVTKAFLPLIRRNQGRVVNISSIMGRIATPFSSAYCMSKFSIEAFSDILRLEMKKFNVKVITIEPGNYAAATQLAVPNGLVDQSQLCRQFWEKMDDSIKNDYGIKSLERVTVTSDITKRISNGDSCLVLNALESSLMLKYPQIRYFVAPWTEKAVVYLCMFLPDCISDEIILRIPSILEILYHK